MTDAAVVDVPPAEPPVDGRNARAARTRAKIIAACRAKMLAGDFRPSVIGVAQAADCSVSSVFQHFIAVEVLHKVALDEATRDAIYKMIIPWARTEPLPEIAESVVHAAVFGRPLASVADHG